jgi:hypothetical protein
VIGQWGTGGDQFVLYIIDRHPSKSFTVTKFFYDFLQTLPLSSIQKGLDGLFQALAQEGRAALKVDRQSLFLLPDLHEGKEKNKDADHDDNR